MALKEYFCYFLGIQVIFLCCLETTAKLEEDPFSSCCKEQDKKHKEMSKLFKNKLGKQRLLDEQNFLQMAERLEEQSKKFKADILEIENKFLLSYLDLKEVNKHQENIIKELQEKINSLKPEANIVNKNVNQTNYHTEQDIFVIKNLNQSKYHQQQDISELRSEFRKFKPQIVEMKHELNESKQQIHDLYLQQKLINKFPLQLFLISRELHESKEQQLNVINNISKNINEIQPKLLKFNTELDEIKQQQLFNIDELKAKSNVTSPELFKSNEKNNIIDQKEKTRNEWQQKFIEINSDLVNIYGLLNQTINKNDVIGIKSKIESFKTNQLQENNIFDLQRRMVKVENHLKVAKGEVSSGETINKCHSNIQNNLTKHICEHGHNQASLSCDDNSDICILDAFYGRLSYSYCLTSQIYHINCKLPLLDKVKKLCHGQNFCDLTASNSWAGMDPCEKTEKYLEVTYFCSP